MAISWRRRGPVIRVLAAVYAELGEETFKGRYGRIAKLYGDEATYDSIKSFFAKEVVTMAKSLKTNSRNGGDSRHSGPQRQRQRGLSRFSSNRMEDSDNEVVVTGERSLQVQHKNLWSAQRAAEAPGRGLSQLSEDDFSLQHVPPTFHHTGGLTSNKINSSMREISRDGQPPGADSEKMATSRKRSYSTFREGDDRPPSFGYVTNHGKHRCVLCMTELGSAELLRKHESLSKLHLTNLKDRGNISRASMMLEHMNNMTNAASLNEMEPLMRGVSNERGEQMPGEQATQRSNSQTPFTRARMTPSQNRFDVACEIIPIVDEPVIEADHPEQPASDNVEFEQINAYPITDHERVLNPTTDEQVPRAQTVPIDISTVLPAELHANRQKDSLIAQPITATALSTHVADMNDIDDVRPMQVVQILLSRGIELLAKQCVEEHPELRTEFLKRVKEIQSDVGEVGARAEI